MIADMIGVGNERVRALKFARKITDLDPNRPAPTAAQQVKQ
jgi:hypothetical protein